MRQQERDLVGARHDLEESRLLVHGSLLLVVPGERREVEHGLPDRHELDFLSILKVFNCRVRALGLLTAPGTFEPREGS